LGGEDEDILVFPARTSLLVCQLFAYWWARHHWRRARN